jgi:hypothetical protein
MNRTLGAWVAALALLAVACGQDEPEPATTVDAATPDAGCAPKSATGWKPTWRPPEVRLNSCTEGQIDRQFTLCEGAGGTAEECASFNRDPANAACRSCLYSTEDETTYGPIVYLRNRSEVVNVSGCIAIVDGNLSATGCGAQWQAYESCAENACIESCVAFEDFQRCTTQARSTVCRAYDNVSACAEPSTYDVCLGPATFEGLFRATARLFCGTGRSDGGTDVADATIGVADAGSDAAGSGDGARPDGAAAASGSRRPLRILPPLRRDAPRRFLGTGIGQRSGR